MLSKKFQNVNVVEGRETWIAILLESKYSQMMPLHESCRCDPFLVYELFLYLDFQQLVVDHGATISVLFTIQDIRTDRSVSLYALVQIVHI